MKDKKKSKDEVKGTKIIHPFIRRTEKEDIRTEKNYVIIELKNIK